MLSAYGLDCLWISRVVEVIGKAKEIRDRTVSIK